MNWSTYAKCYDLMAENNPEYQKLFPILQRSLGKLQLSSEEKIFELGSGTGNFSLKLSDIFHKNIISAVELNPEMLKLAAEKFKLQNKSNIILLNKDYHDLLLFESNISVIVAVHSIYCSNKHELLLKNIYDSLKPGGIFFAIDLGRKMDVSDWRRYIFKYLYHKKGFFQSIITLIKGFLVLLSNKKIRSQQDRGAYWVHSAEEFINKITNAGFEINNYATCYRNYSDWVFAFKPAESI
ncbi:MAG: SAM-dependent methyltransferase [Verrucomicrobiales bacterium]|nr:SAM-dependent methyltransferase [Verrucomicrobiales bacterium]